MDRRSRACMLLHTRSTDVVEVGQIVGTRNTAQHQNMQSKECQPGHSGLGVSCLRVFESSAKGHALVNWRGGEVKKNEDGTAQEQRRHGGDTWSLEQAGPGRLGTKIGH